MIYSFINLALFKRDILWLTVLNEKFWFPIFCSLLWNNSLKIQYALFVPGYNFFHSFFTPRSPQIGGQVTICNSTSLYAKLGTWYICQFHISKVEYIVLPFESYWRVKKSLFWFYDFMFDIKMEVFTFMEKSSNFSLLHRFKE